MFVDLDWPLNASSLLSASAELLVMIVIIEWYDMLKFSDSWNQYHMAEQNCKMGYFWRLKFLVTVLFLLWVRTSLCFYRATLYVKRGLCCRSVSVCPSVTLVYCIQTAEDIVKRLSQPGSSIILVFFDPERPNSKGNPLQQGRKIHGDGEILRFSTEIAVYLGNGTR